MARKARWPARICQVGIERGADRLRDAKHHAADQRAPHTAQPADDDGLEGEDQPDRSRRRIENCADAEQDAGDRGEDHRDAERQRIELAIVDAHQLGGVGIVGDGAKGAAEPVR